MQNELIKSVVFCLFSWLAIESGIGDEDLWKSCLHKENQIANNFSAWTGVIAINTDSYRK